MDKDYQEFRGREYRPRVRRIEESGVPKRGKGKPLVQKESFMLTEAASKRCSLFRGKSGRRPVWKEHV